MLLPLANKATEFTLGVYYPAGTVVTFAGVTYLAIQDGSNIAPNTSLDVWLPVAAGTIPKDVGNWYAPRSYEIGECVHATPVVVDTGIMSGPHPPGTVHVEKYSQSDFALLGIPLTFPQAF